MSQQIHIVETVNLEVDLIIKSLRSIAKALTRDLSKWTTSELVDLLGSPPFFGQLSTYPPQEETQKTFQRSCAYLLVIQLLLYHILTRNSTNQFIPLNPDLLKDPSNLDEYFMQIPHSIYQSIFGYNVATQLPHQSLPTIRKAIQLLQKLGPTQNDLFNSFLQQIIPFNIRKKLAIFYTLPQAANLLTSLTINDPHVKVADLACGSGSLLLASYRRKRALLEQQRPFTEADHRCFMKTDLMGVEVMPLAASIAAARLTSQNPTSSLPHVNIKIQDALELIPSPSYDLILMNPPFTRQERIPESYKSILHQRFKDYDEYLHRQMGYYGYFLLLADQFLRANGRLAFILPAAFLGTRSNSGLRRFLSTHYNLEYVITGNHQLNFSETTWRREILLIAKKEKANSGHSPYPLFITLFKLPETQPLNNTFQETLQTLNIKSTNYCEDTTFGATRISSSKLTEYSNWFNLFPAPQGLQQLTEVCTLIQQHTKGLLPLGDLYDLSAILRRGIETAKGMQVQNAFILRYPEHAIRQTDRWILTHQDEKRLIISDRHNPNLTLEIPASSVESALRTTANKPCMELKDENDFVLVRYLPNSAVATSFGDQQILRTLFLQWNKYVKRRKGNLILLRRFPILSPSTIHLGYYTSTPLASPGTTWVFQLPDDEAKLLCLWCNSSLFLAQILSSCIEDLWLDLHRYILTELSFLNVHELSLKAKKKLLAHFDTIRRTSFPCLFDQFSIPKMVQRHQLDRLLLRVLGYSQGNTTQLLDQLYPAIHHRFGILQGLDNSRNRAKDSLNS